MRITPPMFPAYYQVERPSGPINCCEVHTPAMIAWCRGMGWKPLVRPAPAATVCAICTREYREKTHE